MLPVSPRNRSDASLNVMVLNRRCPVLVLPLLALVGLGMVGCANPGPPRPPSLKLPAFVKDLAATRRGDVVELRFTVPQRTTDGLPLHLTNVTAKFCRAVDTGACVPVAELPEQNFAVTAKGQPGQTNSNQTGVNQTAKGQIDQANVAVAHDALPATLTAGAARVLTYRVELYNDTNHTGGFSEPAYAAGGATPSPVEELHAQGSRLGVVLSWKPSDRPAADDGIVVLRREDLAPKPKAPVAHKAKVAAPAASSSEKKPVTTHGSSTEPKPAKAKSDAESNIVWLTTAPQPDPLAGDATDKEASVPAQPVRDGITLDDTALADEPYRYTAERRRSVQVGGRTMEMQSEVSAPVEFTLQDVYPPPAPTDLNAASFANPKLTVDLIWQPVDTPHLAGYNVYRETLDGNGAATGVKTRLNQVPVPAPGFHDVTAVAGQRYRYSVTAVDAKGNESESAVTVLGPEGP
ncbi:hypothetical protein HDF15_001487 [Granulicella mallensis]|uniref:Fibronectin type-III domain-containing protein n=2 Tax=Granulicella mallensis TaxID=940614 RepID=A0A7W7ZP60_9BACT|nr:hypothetical protein [Granulicella mallensis]